MSLSRVTDEVRAAIAAIERDDIEVLDKVEMLMEIAMGLQTQPKSPADLLEAVTLYEKALALCPENDALLKARLTARMGTALQSVPTGDSDYLMRAESSFEEALKILNEQGNPEEVAEVEMNLGLVLQTLAGQGKRRIVDAITAYQRALRVFDKKAFPKEFAILQSNLATAFLSMPYTDQNSKMREAMAVQAFEEGLKVVNLIDHPVEYAMLQNNLGNALQYASSSHIVENNLQALNAYDEALKVRTREARPLEYANTISNKANCLINLPDDPENPELRNQANLLKARSLYKEAREIFDQHGETEKSGVIAEVLNEIQQEFGSGSDARPNGTGSNGTGSNGTGANIGS